MKKRMVGIVLALAVALAGCVQTGIGKNADGFVSLAEAVPEDGEAINTTVVDEVGSTQVITSEMDEAAFLRSQIVEISRTRYTVPEGVLDENGRMESFNNDLVIRYLDKMIVKDDGYEVVFKAGVKVQVEV